MRGSSFTEERLRTFLMTWIVSDWPACIFAPCGGYPISIPCAAAIPTKMEATKIDNNFMFREKIALGMFLVCKQFMNTHPPPQSLLGGQRFWVGRSKFGNHQLHGIL